MTRLVRIAWMIEMLHRSGFTRSQFSTRFKVSERSFRRDLLALREAGFYIEAPTSMGADRRYRSLYFCAESEAA